MSKIAQPIDNLAFSMQLSRRQLSLLRANFATLILLCGPLAALCSQITLLHFDGSLYAFSTAVLHQGPTSILMAYMPTFSWKASMHYVSYFLLQTLLYLFLPGQKHTGQRTPAGYLLLYCTNGLAAWAVTLGLFLVLSWQGVIDPGCIAKDWPAWVAVMNATGLLLAVVAYVKAYLHPSHPEDCSYTGSAVYDFYMGIEHNPRIGSRYDFKLFTVGRLGMLLWSLIDISNVAYQYQTIGFVTLPLLFITILHLVYTVDFFIYEKWYLRTMDIAHDHYGFYLAWGSTAWLPMMYSLQVQYAARHVNASHLSLPSVLYFLFVFILGLVAYAVFRDANNQKYDVRRFGGQCSVWGRPAEFITATYQTTDGTKHTSLLICSGWWGHARHANYTADLVLSTCMCALAGLTMNLIVWFYAIYMAVLLLHRVSRDEERCAAKYRSAWTDYCQRVPWRLVPGLY